MTWLLLSDSHVDHRCVRLRFVPDTFMHEHEAPVLEVTIEEAEKADEIIATLARFRDEYVVDIEIKPSELCLSGDMDTEDTIVRGGCFSSRQVHYSREELLSIAKFFQSKLQDEETYSHQLSSKINGVTHFVTGLIERGENRRSLSDKSTASVDSQIAVLERVRNKLNDA